MRPPPERASKPDVAPDAPSSDTRRSPHLRIARPCDALEALVAMYRDGLGLHVLGGFENHDGYDGAMLGLPGGPYHLELTRRRGQPAGPAPSAEHLLVFYEADPSAWEAACARMLAAGFRTVPAENAYWDVRGRTFADLEGYLVVWQRSTWPVTA